MHTSGHTQCDHDACVCIQCGAVLVQLKWRRRCRRRRHDESIMHALRTHTQTAIFIYPLCCPHSTLSVLASGSCVMRVHLLAVTHTHKMPVRCSAQNAHLFTFMGTKVKRPGCRWIVGCLFNLVQMFEVYYVIVLSEPKDYCPYLIN